MWQFLSPWSDMYDLDEGGSFLRAVSTQLGTAKFNVQRFAGALPPLCCPPPSPLLEATGSTPDKCSTGLRWRICRPVRYGAGKTREAMKVPPFVSD